MTDWPLGFTCGTCGQSHAGMPFSFAADFPDMYANMTEENRELRAVVGSDQCILDSQWFFIRGLLEIPIIGSDEPFLWVLWASVREGVFDEITDCWELPGREKHHGPFKGRLANMLPVYTDTLNLKLNIILQPLGTRPLFVVEDEKHEMEELQRSGFTLEQATELASFLLHIEGNKWAHS